MRISICIPAYHREQMLCQAILSILIQQDPDFEIVIRDDDFEHPVSANSEVQKLFQFCGSQLVYLVDDSHIGTFSGVANAVLKQATGDILYLMGSDDLLAPGALHSIREVFENERFGGPVWIYGKTVSVDEHLRRTGIDGEPTTYESMLEKNRIGCPAVFWNRQMMNMVGALDGRYKWAADYDLWLRFWGISEPVFIDRELGIFRHHNQHMSTEQAADIEGEAQRVSQRHQCFRDIIKKARLVQTLKQNYGDMIPEASG